MFRMSFYFLSTAIYGRVSLILNGLLKDQAEFNTIKNRAYSTAGILWSGGGMAAGEKFIYEDN